jgi:CO/xanthine dehydrogenase Mo-binding subunit
MTTVDRAISFARQAEASLLPESLRGNRYLNQWLYFRPDGHVEVYSGKVEIGQGIVTALAQIAAEELDVTPEQIRMIAANTATSPNEAVTSGSLSIRHSGSALRHACAQARALFLQHAAQRFGLSAAAVADLKVVAGEITDTAGRRTSYWALADSVLLDVEIDCPKPPKRRADYKTVGAAMARADLAEKFYGLPRYVHDIELPGMLHGAILRPPSRAATLTALDESPARACEGVVAVVRDGSLLGVLADSDHHAKQALGQLRKHAQWAERGTLPDQANLADWLRQQEAETRPIFNKRAPAGGNPVARTLTADYTKPFVAHATGVEPIEFRLRYLHDPRARVVLERVVERSRWHNWQPAEGRGHGVGFARYKNEGAYCAVVAEVDVEAELRVKRLIIAVDVGVAINPDSVINQIEGGAIQATSWTLKEAVRFDRQRVTSDSWETYPILRFPEIPAVVVDLIHSGAPSVGAGEASLGPTAAAISNALHHALGVRVTELPLTVEHIVAAFK